jgi:hypothetical protein
LAALENLDFRCYLDGICVAIVKTVTLQLDFLFFSLFLLYDCAHTFYLFQQSVIDIFANIFLFTKITVSLQYIAGQYVALK